MSLISGNESKIFAKGVIGNVRKAQEDSHGWKLETPNGDLFVVCDGMGGHVGGAMASRLAVDSIVGFIGKEQYATPVEALNGALQFANMQILGYAAEHPEYQGMGTTACIVLIQGDGVWIAHVGDSRIYLYLGKEKQLHRITKDHSYVQTLVDAGEITDEEAEHHPNKNRILKALGIKPELQPTFNYENKPIHPKNGDVFLICSDGLSGMIPDRTIWSVLGEDSLTLQQKGDTLIDRAMEGETVCPGGQDNCTVELIEVDKSPWKESEFKSYNPKGVTYEAPARKKEPTFPKQNTINHTTNEGGVRIEAKGNGSASNKRLFKIIAISLAALLIVGGIVWIVLSAKGSKNDNKNAEITAIQEHEEEESNEEVSVDKVANESQQDANENTQIPIDQIKQEDLQDSINKWDKQIKKLKTQQEKLNVIDNNYLSKSQKLQTEIDVLQKKIDQAAEKRDGK
jgi:serine/threonine protein phosphatase PrpC